MVKEGYQRAFVTKYINAVVKGIEYLTSKRDIFNFILDEIFISIFLLNGNSKKGKKTIFLLLQKKNIWQIL